MALRRPPSAASRARWANLARRQNTRDPWNTKDDFFLFRGPPWAASGNGARAESTPLATGRAQRQTGVADAASTDRSGQTKLVSLTNPDPKLCL